MTPSETDQEIHHTSTHWRELRGKTSILCNISIISHAIDHIFESFPHTRNLYSFLQFVFNQMVISVFSLNCNPVQNSSTLVPSQTAGLQRRSWQCQTASPPSHSLVPPRQLRREEGFHVQSPFIQQHGERLIHLTTAHVYIHPDLQYLRWPAPPREGSPSPLPSH